MKYRHLRFWMQTAYESGFTDHSQRVMKSLGIVYQDAIPQTIGDQWWFLNCENIPSLMPDFLVEFNDEPSKFIGHGLSEKDAQKLSRV